MGMIAADKVVDRAAILLYDRTKRTWPVPELLEWLNDGVLHILQYRPDVYTVKRALQLAAGTRQQLPAGDLYLLDMPRNLGQDGQTPGIACRYIDRKQLDLSDPAWHNRPASATVRHWMYDQAVPGVFWVYPQQPTSGRGYVELDVSTPPARMTINGVGGATVTSKLPIADTWVNALTVFTVYRAFSTDNENTQIGGKADLAYREFQTVLGVDTTVRQRFAPKQNQPPRYEAPRKSDQQGAFGTP